MRFVRLAVAALSLAFATPVLGQEAKGNGGQEVPTVLNVPWNADKATVKRLMKKKGYNFHEDSNTSGILFFDGFGFATILAPVSLSYSFDDRGKLESVTVFIQNVADGTKEALLGLLEVKYGSPSGL